MALFWVVIFLAGPWTGCGLDTEGMLIEVDTMVSDDDAADGDGSVDVNVDDHRPDGDVPHDPPADEGGPPEVPDAETEGPATCASAGTSYCDDGLECTEDSCRDEADRPACDHAILSDFCLVDGACRAAWFINLDNECMICDPAVNNAWSPVADRTPCYWGGGLCCSGWCMPGANCCSSADCVGCGGTALPCEDFYDEAGCAAQWGCGWAPSSGYCQGGSRCDAFGSSSTCATCGCGWDYSHCDPDEQVYPCSSLTSSGDCAAARICGCSWVETGGGCSGTPTACGVLDVSSCEYQSGCSWGESGTCNPTTFICEYSS